MEVQIHSFLTSALYGGEWSVTTVCTQYFDISLSRFIPMSYVYKEINLYTSQHNTYLENLIAATCFGSC